MPSGLLLFFVAPNLLWIHRTPLAGRAYVQTRRLSEGTYDQIRIENPIEIECGA